MWKCVCEADEVGALVAVSRGECSSPSPLLPSLTELCAAAGMASALSRLSFSSQSALSSALDAACFSGNADCAKVLISAGAPLFCGAAAGEECRQPPLSREARLGISTATKHAQLSADCLECRVDWWGFESFSAPQLAATRGAVYYEATLAEAGLMQIGWASPGCIFVPEHELGVGDTADSFAVDLCRNCAWHAERSSPFGGSVHWKRGDVLGCFCDLDRRVIGFSLNGQYLGDAFSGFAEMPFGLCPALTVDKFQRVRLNFGMEPFRFPPPAPFTGAALASLLQEVDPGLLPPQRLLARVPPDSRKSFASALHWAAARNNTECVRLLLESFPNEIASMLASTQTESPLDFAVQNGALESARMIADAANNPGLCIRALWSCCRVSDPAVGLSLLHLLLLHSTNFLLLHALDALGRNLLHVAAADDALWMVEFLLSRIDSNASAVCKQDKRGWTPLMYAVHNNHIDCAELLLKSGATITSPDHGDAAAQHGNLQPIVAAVSSPAALEFLLNRGANPNYADGSGMTPLMYAALNYHSDSARILLARGADPNFRGRRGKTALHYAAIRGATECVKVLLAHGAQVEERDDDGLTPLLHTAEYGYTGAARAILDAGGDANCGDLHRGSPLQYAASRGALGLAFLLIERGAKLASGLHWMRPETHGKGPAPLRAHTATVVGSRLVVVGGVGSKRELGDIACLDLGTNTWSCFKNAIEPRCYHAAASIGNTLFVIGGSRRDFLSIDFPSGSPQPAHVQATGDLPEVALLPCMFSFRTTLFLFGGRPEVHAVARPTLHTFDTTSGVWTIHFPEEGDLWPPIGFYCCTTIGNEAFFVSQSEKLSELLYVLDARTLKFRLQPLRYANNDEATKLRPLAQPAIFSVGRRIFLVGGVHPSAGEGLPHEDSYVINIDSFEISPLAVEMAGPEKRREIAAAAVGTKAFLCGGTDERFIYSDLFALDLGDKTHAVPEIASAALAPLFTKANNSSEDAFSDITLSVGGALFHAHKVVLSARSSVFRRLFCASGEWGSRDSVSVPEVSPRIFGMVLEFVYADHVPSSLLVPGDSRFSVELASAVSRWIPELAEEFCQCILDCEAVSKHASSLPANMEAVVGSPAFSDISFAVEGHTVLAHKALLCAGCEYFRALLSSQMGDRECTSIELPADTSRNAFLAVLRHIYARTPLGKDAEARSLADFFGLVTD